MDPALLNQRRRKLKCSQISFLLSHLRSTSPAPTGIPTCEKSLPHPFSIKHLSIFEVFQKLQHLSPHRSTSGPIPNRFLRETSDVIAESLTELYNMCIRTSAFPDEWKSAEVIPIYKGKGSTQDPTCYRPISLLNSVSKVFESLVNSQIYRFVESNSILSDKQFGFRKNRSTVDQLVDLVTTLTRGFDDGLFCDANIPGLRESIRQSSSLHNSRRTLFVV